MSASSYPSGVRAKHVSGQRNHFGPWVGPQERFRVKHPLGKEFVFVLLLFRTCQKTLPRPVGPGGRFVAFPETAVVNAGALRLVPTSPGKTTPRTPHRQPPRTHTAGLPHETVSFFEEKPVNAPGLPLKGIPGTGLSH